MMGTTRERRNDTFGGAAAALCLLLVAAGPLRSASALERADERAEQAEPATQQGTEPAETPLSETPQPESSQPESPLPEMGDAIGAALELFEDSAYGEAYAAAATASERYVALAATDPRRPSARDRALLDYTAALAAGALADELAAATEPDLVAIRQLESDGVARFRRALADAGGDLDQLRERAAYGAGTLLAHGAERTVRRAQTQALMERQEVPFAEGTPERALLEEAEDGFEGAREALLVRLEMDWQHADTRANIEWVQRRLIEIERLRERADEEQQRRDEEEQQEQEQEDEQDDEQEDESSEDESQQDESQQDESGESESEQDGSESEPSEPDEDTSEDEGAADEDGADPNEQEPAEPDAAEQEEAQTPDPADEEGTDATGEASADESADSPEGAVEEPVALTDLEVRRLLQRLAEIEASAEELRRARAISQRRRVERDW